MYSKNRWLLILGVSIATLITFGFAACIKKNDLSVLGYSPVYGSSTDMLVVKSESPQKIVNAGKIYQYGNYTFQMENGEGIHIINTSSRSKLGFIRVKGCSEISIRNNILYTDNFRDLVSIDISNINDVKVVDRLSTVFPGINQEYPPYMGYFECVDPSKGTVIGWTQKVLTNPKCRR
jgi:hypothetical protein